MASIIISFVGNQDPYSDHTKEEGSIVTLVKHLLDLKQQIKQILLLGTSGTKERAEFTKEWLQTELRIPEESIETLVVAESLSQDPVNILLASNEAKQAIERVGNIINDTDYLELNASSGTPAMKSTWSILQAAGYAPRSHVWQVRNPKEMQAGQDRVFATDVSVLKTEFDRNIIKQQLADYNYSGALATIRSSSLTTPIIEALLNYGHSRLSFDFNRANASIVIYKEQIDPELRSSIASLRQKNTKALVKEIYFITEIKLRNQEYCDFLICVSQFEENILRLLLSEDGFRIPTNYNESRKFWVEIGEFDGGKLEQHLKGLNLGDYNIHIQGDLNVPTMMEIIRWINRPMIPIERIARLRGYCIGRNNYIHRLEGVSHIDEAQTILTNIKGILKQVTELPDRNPFDLLNDQIFGLLL